MSGSVTEDLGRAVLPRPAASPFAFVVRRAGFMHCNCAAGIASEEPGGQRCSFRHRSSARSQREEQEITGAAYCNIPNSHALAAFAMVRLHVMGSRSLMAFGRIAALVIGGGVLLEGAGAVFVSASLLCTPGDISILRRHTAASRTRKKHKI
jgi:hypothetical protein